MGQVPGQTREEVADHQSGQQGEHKAQFPQAQGPADVEGFPFVGGGGQIGVIPQDVGQDGDPVDHGESPGELLHIRLHEMGAQGSDPQGEQPGGRQRSGAAQPGIGLGYGAHRLGGIDPHPESGGPAQQVKAPDLPQAQQGNEQAQPYCPPVFAAQQSRGTDRRNRFFVCHHEPPHLHFFQEA